ncbi:FAD-dependent oxidoreductase [Arsenicicoccus piscis]|uniref:FAD/NAD(P)-binding oxidoreductase n=1 Tax=Arsenicicoccus piscis TaxID=673954 RepID=A0ABQ6HVK3_9MICO|nr:FAD-dependent oxidoreductase [Arsenicicoccus piscis]GMA21903.1 FAD/NAD(P)-binding oxidoreductase [Arsenicicoccus piscis]
MATTHPLAPAHTLAPAHRVVVVGHGMVAARFVDELDRLVPAQQVDVTVLGEERERPYNRLLLSEVLSGRASIESLTLPDAPPHVRVHRGAAADRLDLGHGLVHDRTGGTHPFDTVVLATGASANIPALEGFPVPGVLPAGVVALRTLQDCRQILADVGQVRHAVVLGGGLLGVEVASGLATHGVSATVVHSGGHPLDRQLDRDSGRVLGLGLRDLGVSVRARSRAHSITLGPHGRVRSVILADGTEVLADLVLVTTGVTPRTELARAAGLPVGRGVVVGDDLRSPLDPRVAAIGDCAETPDGCPGLLQPGWDQAVALAADLAGRLGVEVPARREADELGAHDVIRLKAAGLSVVTLGRMPTEPAWDDESLDGIGDLVEGGPRILSLVDRTARRSIRMAVEDGRVGAAVVVGDGAVAAALTAAYERGTPVPADAAHLLVAGASGAVPVVENPALIPAGATVCRCNGVTKGDLVSACSADDDRTLATAARKTRATTGCGGCRGAVEGLLAWLDQVDPPQCTSPAAVV